LDNADLTGASLTQKQLDSACGIGVNPDSPYAWVRKGQGLPVKAP